MAAYREYGSIENKRLRFYNEVLQFICCYFFRLLTILTYLYFSGIKHYEEQLFAEKLSLLVTKLNLFFHKVIVNVIVVLLS